MVPDQQFVPSGYIERVREPEDPDLISGFKDNTSGKFRKVTCDV
jgi:hypothetical protein